MPAKPFFSHPDPEPSPLMNATQVAAYIGASRKSVYAWEKLGLFPKAMRRGRFVRWRRSDIDAWIASHFKEPPAAGDKPGEPGRGP